MSSNQDIHSPNPGAIVELYTLDASSRGQGIFYFSPNANEKGSGVVFNGTTYAGIPVVGDGWTKSTNGSAPRPTITVDNTQRAMQAAVIAAGDLVNCPLTRTRVFSKYLDDVNFKRWNLLNYSQAFSNAVWYTPNCSASAGGATAPDGSAFATTITATASANTYLQQTATYANPANTTFTFSVWLKAGTMTGTIALRLRDGTGASDLVNVTVTPTTTWTQYTLTGTFGASPAANVIVYIDPGNDTPTVGQNYYVWGAQLELGSAFTTYQPTTTTHFFTSDPSQILSTDKFIINRKISHNNTAIQWELCWTIDKPGVRLPRRQVLRDFGFPGIGLNVQ